MATLAGPRGGCWGVCRCRRWPLEPQRRWGQGPDAQGRVGQGPWATGPAKKRSSPQHPAGSGRPARREDAGTGHASPCSSQALPGADGPVAGSQPLGSQVGGWPGLLHQLTYHIDPPVGSIAVDLPPLLCGTKGGEWGKILWSHRFRGPLCVARSSCQVQGATILSHPGVAGWPPCSPPNGGKGPSRSQVATWGEA